jgi:hypothetical protein
MNKYVLAFASVYLVLTALLAVVTTLIDFNGGAGINLVVTFAASVFAASTFVKDQGRAPAPDETKAYSWRALLATWAVSLVLVIVVVVFLFSPDEKDAVLKVLAWPMSYLLGVVAALFLSTVYYFAIRWSFSWYAKTAARKASSAP